MTLTAGGEFVGWGAFPDRDPLLQPATSTAIATTVIAGACKPELAIDLSFMAAPQLEAPGSGVRR
jgi:hypothetical protein